MNLKINVWQKLKLLGTFVFGDMADVAGWALDWFNSTVLQRIGNADEARLYCLDVRDFAVFLRAVAGRHGKWMSEAKRAAFVAVIDAVDELAAALEDLKVTREEVSALVRKVRAAIRLFKKARKGK